MGCRAARFRATARRLRHQGRTRSGRDAGDLSLRIEEELTTQFRSLGGWGRCSQMLWGSGPTQRSHNHVSRGALPRTRWLTSHYVGARRRGGAGPNALRRCRGNVRSDCTPLPLLCPRSSQHRLGPTNPRRRSYSLTLKVMRRGNSRDSVRSPDRNRRSKFPAE